MGGEYDDGVVQGNTQKGSFCARCLSSSWNADEPHIAVYHRSGFLGCKHSNSKSQRQESDRALASVS